jgi:hypothetical protein
MRIILFALFCAAMLASGCISPGPTTQQSGANDTASLSAIQDMKDILRSGHTIEYMATYVVNYSLFGNSSTMNETYYMKAGNARVDVLDGNTSASIFKIGSDTYSCQPFGGNVTCSLASANVTDDTDLAASLEANIDTYVVSTLPDRTIFGLNAKCFQVSMRDGTTNVPDVLKPSVMGSDVEFGYCFSADGIPLEFWSPFSRMYITGLNRSVPDSAFALPANPQ